MSDCIGWDLGGAHLKAAKVRLDGTVASTVQLPCPLWRGLDELRNVFPEVCRELGESTYHAITMTGEMADCFISRDEGVCRIIQTMRTLLQKPFWVYVGAEGFLDSQAVFHQPEKAAATNWHATASCLSAFADKGILMDIGTTTTDIIPFAEGHILDCGISDSERLAFGSLVYTGAVRTPVMAMAETVRVGDAVWATVAEQFAVAADIHCLLGDLSADEVLYPSCDGEDMSPQACARRLARMFACDYDGGMDFWRQIARQIADRQMRKIISAYSKVCRAVGFDSPVPLLGAGAGHFMVRRIADLRAGDTVSRYQEAAVFLGLNQEEARRTGSERVAANCVSAVGLAHLLQHHLTAYDSAVC